MRVIVAANGVNRNTHSSLVAVVLDVHISNCSPPSFSLSVGPWLNMVGPLKDCCAAADPTSSTRRTSTRIMHPPQLPLDVIVDVTCQWTLLFAAPTTRTRT